MPNFDKGYEESSTATKPKQDQPKKEVSKPAIQAKKSTGIMGMFESSKDSSTSKPISNEVDSKKEIQENNKYKSTNKKTSNKGKFRLIL